MDKLRVEMRAESELKKAKGATDMKPITIEMLQRNSGLNEIRN